MKGRRPGGNFRRGGKKGRWSPKTGGGPPNLSQLTLKRIEGKRYELIAPECAVDRDLDLEEAQAMRDGGEAECARDELLYLVADCRGFLEAHNLLGELALEEEDIPLARGHYGFAYECGLAALPQNFKGELPAGAGYNRHFHSAGRGLARCLIAKGNLIKGQEVLELLARFDPQEPDTQSLLAQLREKIMARRAAGEPLEADDNDQAAEGSDEDDE
jgi:hypothetical protein